MDSRWLLIAVLLFALPLEAAELAGTIKVTKGEVAIVRGGHKTAASIGAVVFSGDCLVTGANGSTGVTLRDNTLLSVGPQSTFILDRFAFDGTTHAGTVDASLKRGSLAVVSGKIAKQPANTVQFRTPTTILGVRGTEFLIDVQDGED
jgi:hypothetical protein